MTTMTMMVPSTMRRRNTTTVVAKNRLSARVVFSLRRISSTTLFAARFPFLVSILWVATLVAPSVGLATSKRPVIIQVLMNETALLTVDYHVLPRVGKCCPVNEVLTKDVNGEAKCRSADELTKNVKSSMGDRQNIFSPLFSDFNRTGALTPGDERDSFYAIVGDPCHYKRYMLLPAESSYDEYYLLLNGSIFAPNHVPIMLAPGHDYCMDIVPELGDVVALVCFPEEDNRLTIADARITFYACGLLISVPFLVMTIVAYCITPSLMDVHGKALCHYCGCLAVAFTSLAVAQLASGHLSDDICLSVAFVIQFSFVACFFWLNVMCIETWLQVRRHVDTTDSVDGALTSINNNNNNNANNNFYMRSTEVGANRLFFYYSLWAWIPPALLVIISMIMDLTPTIPTTYVKPNFGTQSCWFESDKEAMPYFYVPVGLLVIANIILFTMTSMILKRHQRDLDLRRLARNHESDREERRQFRRFNRIFMVCLGLFFLMGINWTMELLSWWAGGDPLAWSAFDLINALQGLLVFGVFVMRRPVRSLIWYQIQKLRGIDAEQPDISSTDRSLLSVIHRDSIARHGDV